MGARFATAGNLDLDPHQTSPSILSLGYLFGAPAKAVEGLERDARHSTSINGIADHDRRCWRSICAASVHPENFDRQRLTLEGIAAGLRKGTSHGGTKYMTFLLRSSAGCGSVFVYVPVSTALRNGDHVQVEGTFERQHLRDGSTFHNVLGATRIIALPR